MNTDIKVLCPSYRCEDGAILLGVVQSDGTVGMAADRIEIDAAFVEIAHRGRSPQARFRFAGPCQQGHCRQWADGRCGVIEKVLVGREEPPGKVELPACSIRASCRWYRQRRGAACLACPEVITDMSLAYAANDAPGEVLALGTERVRRP